MTASLLPQELLELLIDSDSNLAESFALIDVRSEGEFAVGALPGFKNLPILNNSQRALVGTCFKQEGQSAAIDLGHKVVESGRVELIASWFEQISVSKLKKAIVHCWRGGLRSKISCQWILDNGGEALLLKDGYKALRGLLLAQISAPKKLIILSGFTGSNKTSLLNEFYENSVDLEAQACHRGSSFGLAIGAKQPSQQSFENSLGLAFARLGKKTILLEDESKLIGHCYVGQELHEQMSQAPRVILQVSLEQRISNIIEQYISEPRAQGFSDLAVKEHLQKALLRLKKSLGGLLYEQARQSLEKSAHEDWVRLILTNYYDKTYRYSLAKYPKPIIFQGDRDECQAFLADILPK